MLPYFSYMIIIVSLLNPLLAAPVPFRLVGRLFPYTPPVEDNLRLQAGCRSVFWRDIWPLVQCPPHLRKIDPF